MLSVGSNWNSQNSWFHLSLSTEVSSFWSLLLSSLPCKLSKIARKHFPQKFQQSLARLQRSEFSYRPAGTICPLDYYLCSDYALPRWNAFLRCTVSTVPINKREKNIVDAVIILK